MITLLRFLSICITLIITACAAPVELLPSADPIDQVRLVVDVDYLVGSVTGLDYGEAVTLRLERLSTDDLYRGYQPQGTELLRFNTGNVENWHQAVSDLSPGPYRLTAEADGYISLKGSIIFQIPEQEAVWHRIDLDFEMVRPEHASDLVEVPLCAEASEGGGTYRLPKGTATPTPSVFGGGSSGWPPGTCYAGHLRSRYFVHDLGMMGLSTGLPPGEKANLFVYILPPKPGENYSHAIPPRNGFIDPPALTPLSAKPAINPEWPRLATVEVAGGNWGIIGHLGGGRKLVFVHAPGWNVEPPAYEVVTFASKLPALTSGIDFTFQPGGPATPTPSDTPFGTSSASPLPDYMRPMLSRAFLQDANALCEWEFWGAVGDEHYVWAYCESSEPVVDDHYSAVSAPAVIHTDGEGIVERVEIPRDGSFYGEDIHRLFPQDVQKRIFAHEFDAKAAGARIAERRRMPTPTATPIDTE